MQSEYKCTARKLEKDFASYFQHFGLINKIPGVNIGEISQLYRGTDKWGGGFTYMNEGGCGELAMLPGGTRVIPHDVSMKYAREAGRQQGYQTPHRPEQSINLNRTIVTTSLL